MRKTNTLSDLTTTNRPPKDLWLPSAIGKSSNGNFDFERSHSEQFRNRSSTSPMRINQQKMMANPLALSNSNSKSAGNKLSRISIISGFGSRSSLADSTQTIGFHYCSGISDGGEELQRKMFGNGGGGRILCHVLLLLMLLLLLGLVVVLAKPASVDWLGAKIKKLFKGIQFT